MEPEHSFLNLSRIRSCSWSFRLGFVHETIDTCEHVIRTPVWINPNTSFSQRLRMPCSLLQRNLARSVRDVVQQPPTGNSQEVACPEHLSCIPSSQGTPKSVCSRQVLRGLACAILAWPTHQEFHRAGEPIEVQSAFSHHPWIPQPRLRPQKCSLPDSRRANR